MVRLQAEMAVISTISDVLKQSSEDMREISIASATILRHIRALEESSGYAIINAFSERTMEQFLEDNYTLFQFLPYTAERQDATYRLRLENLQLPDASQGMSADFSRAVIRQMMVHLDPAINYPFELLQKMGVVDALQEDQRD